MLSTYLIAFGLGLLPSVIWLIFFEQEDSDQPEPIKDILYAFILGAVTTFAALAVQIFVLPYMVNAGFSLHSPVGVTIFGGIEELLKFLAVYLLVARRKAFDEPLDAMIYMITVGLGFAAVENIASLINHGATVITPAALQVVVLRFLGATLLHSAASGIIGFHWALGWVRGSHQKLHILAGLIIAIALHGIFNYLILTTGPASWALAFVAIISFFLLIDFEELRTEEESVSRN
jgi:RsiW-degrading membrane proteinase PrsW (M82 family)